MSDARPDHIHCIRKPRETEKWYSWCGRHLGGGFYLTGLDHAACLQTSRIVPCPDCVRAATAELLRLARL